MAFFPKSGPFSGPGIGTLFSGPAGCPEDAKANICNQGGIVVN